MGELFYKLIYSDYIKTLNLIQTLFYLVSYFELSIEIYI